MATKPKKELTTKKPTAKAEPKLPPVINNIAINRKTVVERKYSNSQAFAVMEYTNAATGETEVIWNSRDGAVLNQVPSKDNSSELTHINYERDVINENYKPAKGTRIFTGPVDAPVLTTVGVK